MATLLSSPYLRIAPERRFILEGSPLHSPVARDDLITYTTSKNVSQLRMINPVTHALFLDELSVVVSIDGASREDGAPGARASWAIYFGPGSPHNASGRLDPGLEQTSSRAEIEALSQALRIISRDISKDVTLSQIYIATDSMYLVRAMSEWMKGWIARDGHDTEGKPVAHFEALKELHGRIDKLVDWGMEIKFWHVPREENKGADALAKQALEG